jgi:hypothetical protein
MPRRTLPDRRRALPYDEALARRVIARIGQGVMLRDLWRDRTLPTRGDLRRWRQTNAQFNARLRAAVNAARSRRMSTFSDAGAEAILARIGQGESLKAICRDPDMPSVVTVMLWLKERPGFAAGMAIAREMQAEILMQQGWEIMQAITPENARAAAVQLAHLRWHTGKVSPRKYGRHKPADPEDAKAGQVRHVYVKRFTDAPYPDEKTPKSPIPPPP